MKVYTLPGGTQVTAFGQFQIGNQKYPPNWLQLASDAEIAAAGITVQVVADPPPPLPDVSGVPTNTYIAGLRRRAAKLKKHGDVQGSVDLLLQAAELEK